MQYNGEATAGGQFQPGALPGGTRPDFEGGRMERGGGRGAGSWIGIFTNLGVIAFIVAVIVLPGKLFKSKKPLGVNPGNAA
jgi:hypothetical protein